MIPEQYIVVRYCCIYDDCDKEFTTKFNLKRHVEIVHLNFKRYECSKCGSLFTSKKNLKEHDFLHTGAKPYKCGVCKKNFRHLSFLYVHRRQHQKKTKIAAPITRKVQN